MRALAGRGAREGETSSAGKDGVGGGFLNVRGWGKRCRKSVGVSSGRLALFFSSFAVFCQRKELHLPLLCGLDVPLSVGRVL